MKFPRYPKYKPSGVEWLRKIPEHWEVKRLKFLLNEPLRYGANESAEIDDPDLPRYVRITDIDEHGHLRDDTFRSLPTETAKDYLLSEGDILFARSGATSGKTFLYKMSWGICAYAGYLIRARANVQLISPNFLRYFTDSTPYWDWISATLIQATIQNVSAEKYANLALGLPAIDEQRAIAEFLDRETARLDTLLGKKWELIEKLKEKRTALISRTVTRGLPAEAAVKAGLNPHPKLKPSGIEWLGDIPEHWEVKRIKHVGEIRYGLGEPPEYVVDGIPFIRATDIKRGKIELEAVRKVDRTDVPWRRRPELHEDEILVVRSGAYTGDSAIVTSQVAGCIAGYDMVLTTGKAIPQFVAWVLLSKYMLEGQIHLSRLRAAQPHLNAEELGGFVLLAPPREEQCAIADYLDRETAKINRMMETVEAVIEKLQEYRTALITAAVTGKIDVRNGPKSAVSTSGDAAITLSA